MNSRWAAIVAASLVAFASLVITWQFRHYDGVGDIPYGPYASLALSFLRGEVLPGISNIVDRSREYIRPQEHGNITIWFCQRMHVFS